MKPYKNISDESQIWAAGGVIFENIFPEPKQVLICHRTSENLWSLPKGKPKAGESITQTALREVKEETGVNVKILDKITEINYLFLDKIGNSVSKKVHFFLMESKGGDIRNHDNEFDTVIWENFEKAKILLTHNNELYVLEKAIEMAFKKQT